MSEKNYIEELVGAFANLSSPEEVKMFLQDLCSESELIAIAERLEVAARLKNGQMYSDIASEMDVSSSLIAKVDDVMKRGTGGFELGVEASVVSETCYDSFAEVYDALTYDVEYETRVEYITGLMKKFSDIPVSMVLDLACGTGTVSVMLADKGYDVIGIDSSAEMLAEAIKKQGDRDILFLNQEMRDFELYGTVDAVVCLLDSVNYVLDEDDLLECFKWVNNYLNPGGVFIFDINTKYKLENILAGNIFNDEKDGVFYSWENYFDKEENICEFDLNFFVKNKDGSYKRFNEIHYERAYTDREIKAMLKKAKLELVAVYDDLTENSPAKNSEKVFYIAKKPK